MDPLYLGITIVTLISSASTFATVLASYSQKVKDAEKEFVLQEAEIRVLNLVVMECEDILYEAVEIPESIWDARDICFKHRSDLAELQARIHYNNSSNPTSRLKRATKAVFREKEWMKTFGLFKGSTFLLRDLCSESVDQPFVMIA
jgi:hypothetical protein